MTYGNALFNSSGQVVDGNGTVIGVGEDYAGISAAEAAATLVIALKDQFTKFTGFTTDMPEKISDGQNANDRIKIGATGDYDVSFTASGTAASNNKVYEFHCYQITATGTSITGCTKASPGVVTSVAHGRSNGDEVCILDVVGMTELNLKLYKIANKQDDTFELQDEESVNVDTSGFTTYTSGGTVLQAVKILAHGHQTFAVGADFNSFAGGTIVSLTKDNFIEFYGACETDTTNFTFDDINLKIKRVG